MQQQSDTALFTPDTQPKGAARIGGELRAVRERLGWKLAEVAEGLRIRLPYLDAIERGDLAALPGPAYQTGFVRTYAQALGLDPEEILRRFRAEGLGVVTKAELSFLAPVPDRAVPTGAIVFLGVVLVLVGYGLWFRHTENERRLAEAIPSVPAELAPLAMPKPVIPPAALQTRPATPPAAKPVAPPQLAANTSVAAPAAAPANTQQAAAPAPVPAATAATLPPPPPLATPPVTTATASTPPALAAAAAPPAPASSQTIVATADSWVEVKDPTGNILFSRVLHAGDSWPVPDVAGLTMTAGNAGATEIAANGKPGTPLGAAGAVVRNYALTPASGPTKTN